MRNRSWEKVWCWRPKCVEQLESESLSQCRPGRGAEGLKGVRKWCGKGISAQKAGYSGCGNGAKKAFLHTWCADFVNDLAISAQGLGFLCGFASIYEICLSKSTDRLGMQRPANGPALGRAAGLLQLLFSSRQGGGGVSD